GKQTGLDHENLRQVRGAHILPDPQRFFEVPLSSLQPRRIVVGLNPVTCAINCLPPCPMCIALSAASQRSCGSFNRLSKRLI
ncbi:hypothetical protein, partial [Noviherbaspirillum suwonense]|uniref:hypothetical protein n=1 Tax=Noviherbaspirillum suwonense TaxID=1224511 RepID=UPI0024B673D6